MPGLKSKTTELSGWPMSTASPSWAPSSSSRVSTPSRLSRSARKPTASSLLKSVWRTQRSGLLAAHPPAVAGLGDGEARPSRRPTAAAARSAWPRRPASRPGRGPTISAIAKVSSRSPSPEAAETGKTRSPRSRSSSMHDLGDVAAVGHVDLVQGDQARPVLEAAVPGQLVLDDVEVVDRVAARLHGRGVDRRAPAPRSARCGAGSRGRGRGPRWRPRSGRARRRR